MDRMQQVALHFNTEAQIFDARVLKVVPHYPELLGSLVANLPFRQDQKFRVVDLGCGTGTLAFLIKQRFPRAAVHCVDFAPHMLEQTAKKLAGLSDVTFEPADLRTVQFKHPVHAIVSSLAFHHLEPGRVKQKLHARILEALGRGGVFANADIIRSADPRIQRTSLAKWSEFILQSYSRKELEHNHARYRREDRPAVLLDELDHLKAIGFKRVEVFWKYYNFASYGAFR